jgi:hypothetical protein
LEQLKENYKKTVNQDFKVKIQVPFTNISELVE